jgi:Rrf2 family protein
MPSAKRIDAAALQIVFIHRLEENMRITQEADYAVRIIDRLARQGGRLDAHGISESTGVTLRFTVKILRKLVKSGIVKSFLGVSGGYELAKPPAEVTLRQVIEAVDGPIAICRCLIGEVPCELTDDAYGCDYHRIFSDVSKTIHDKLESITFEKKS